MWLSKKMPPEKASEKEYNIHFGIKEKEKKKAKSLGKQDQQATFLMCIIIWTFSNFNQQTTHIRIVRMLI